MLNCVSVIYLSEQKHLAAKQKEDAWEGKWLDPKLPPHSVFSLFVLFVCLFVFCFLDSLIQQRLKSSLFLSTGHSFLPPHFPEMDSHHFFLPPTTVLHQLNVSASICLPCYIRSERPTSVPSPLCSYFVHAGTVSTTNSPGLPVIFLNTVAVIWKNTFLNRSKASCLFCMEF